MTNKMILTLSQDSELIIKLATVVATYQTDYDVLGREQYIQRSTVLPILSGFEPAMRSLFLSTCPYSFMIPQQVRLSRADLHCVYSVMKSDRHTRIAAMGPRTPVGKSHPILSSESSIRPMATVQYTRTGSCLPGTPSFCLVSA
jgi:hypothetical protein